jgi:hypothetical protein
LAVLLATGWKAFETTHATLLGSSLNPVAAVWESPRRDRVDIATP